MAARLSGLFAHLLLAVSMLLTLWGLLGLLEFLVGAALFVPLQNPAFPPGMQFMHWLAISAGGLAYLAGYYRRWPGTPFLMIGIYAVMATLCFVQTVDLLTNAGRYAAMAAEYVAYVAISVYLVRAERMRRHFRRPVSARG